MSSTAGHQHFAGVPGLGISADLIAFLIFVRGPLCKILDLFAISVTGHYSQHGLVEPGYQTASLLNLTQLIRATKHVKKSQSNPAQLNMYCARVIQPTKHTLRVDDTAYSGVLNETRPAWLLNSVK